MTGRRDARAALSCAFVCLLLAGCAPPPTVDADAPVPPAYPSASTQAKAPAAGSPGISPPLASPVVPSSAPPGVSETSPPSQAAPAQAPLPDGFVYVSDLAPEVAESLRYATKDNFTGAVVDGYGAGVRAVLTRPAAEALARVQTALMAEGLGLKIFDAYRPQRAVDRFQAWAAEPDDPARKAIHYPDIEKSALAAAGYIARRSGHSRGSTVDLTLCDAATGAELDMGGPFDFFGPISHHGASGLTDVQQTHRRRLKGAMAAEGFAAYEKEWWHYTLQNEPFPDTYFDFVVGTG
ncbi:MAG: peptidase M15 [Oscillospiraceae bacterium]|jgi:D-alanyl-D-alanine dipeptidase|nr:peptidase M15 [Oscillospiraceae bacterium]